MGVLDRAWTDGNRSYTHQIDPFTKLLYTNHHIITEASYLKFSFVRALETSGLFVQNSLADNGIALVNRINDVAATKVSGALNDFVESDLMSLEDVNNGAIHSGPHYWYNKEPEKILGAFQHAYDQGLRSGNWGS